jgi:hypothetical protein
MHLGRNLLNSRMEKEKLPNKKRLWNNALKPSFFIIYIIIKTIIISESFFYIFFIC